MSTSPFKRFRRRSGSSDLVTLFNEDELEAASVRLEGGDSVVEILTFASPRRLGESRPARFGRTFTFAITRISDLYRDNERSKWLLTCGTMDNKRVETGYIVSFEHGAGRGTAQRFGRYVETDGVICG